MMLISRVVMMMTHALRDLQLSNPNTNPSPQSERRNWTAQFKAIETTTTNTMTTAITTTTTVPRRKQHHLHCHHHKNNLLYQNIPLPSVPILTNKWSAPHLELHVRYWLRIVGEIFYNLHKFHRKQSFARVAPSHIPVLVDSLDQGDFIASLSGLKQKSPWATWTTLTHPLDMIGITFYILSSGRNRIFKDWADYVGVCGKTQGYKLNVYRRDIKSQSNPTSLTVLLRVNTSHYVLWSFTCITFPRMLCGNKKKTGCADGNIEVFQNTDASSSLVVKITNEFAFAKKRSDMETQY